MKGVKIGVILLVIGIAVAVVSWQIEQQQIREVMDRRWEYIENEYPAGVYRGPEVSEYILKPIPPQPASGGVNLGKIMAGIGLLIIFIKAVQKTP